MTVLFEMVDISKSYGAVQALENVRLTVRGGEVHALMGENGAGKSTLMKILAGVVLPDTGSIRKNGQDLHLRTPKDALEHGISTVFQELSLLPNLSIAENIFLGREPINLYGSIDGKRINALASKILSDLDIGIDPATLVSEISIADRQFVEIARGISANADIVILDEPTAALNAADVEKLNRQIRRLTAEGKAIIYISHRMDEIFSVCDKITVLKDGRYVDTVAKTEVEPQRLIAMMVGREIADVFPPRSAGGRDVVLQIDSMKLMPNSKPFSMSLHRGEIVALAGLEGQGQKEILRALIGDVPAHAGHLTLRGKPVSFPMVSRDSVRRMLSRGIGFVPEDRKDEGLFLSLSIRHNMAISLHCFRNLVAIAKPYRALIADLMAKLQVKAASSQTPVGSLSGGNQQKVLLGRSLASGADILFIEEPTRGVDIGAKIEIYRLLRDFANSGGAILVLSRETIELIGMCDRLLVVHNMTVSAELSADEATEHMILDAALVA